MRTIPQEVSAMAELGDLLRRHGIAITPLADEAGISHTLFYEACNGNRNLGVSNLRRLTRAMEAHHPEAFPDYCRWLGFDNPPINPEQTGNLETHYDDISALTLLVSEVATMCEDGVIDLNELDRVEGVWSIAQSRMTAQLHADRERLAH